jgi:hypothetical protein
MFFLHHRLKVTVTKGHYVTTLNVLELLTIDRILTKFLSWRHLHVMRILTLLWPSFQGHWGLNFNNFYDVPKLLNYWTDLHEIFIMDTSNKDTSHITQVFDLTYPWRSQRSNFEIFTICSNTFNPSTAGPTYIWPPSTLSLLLVLYDTYIHVHKALPVPHDYGQSIHTQQCRSRLITFWTCVVHHVTTFSTNHIRGTWFRVYA